MENEVRETIYISISLVLVAIVLTFVGYITIVRGEIAEIRNSEIQAAVNIEQYREFNGYDCKGIVAEDVVELLRGQYDKLSIFVDYRANDRSGDVVDAANNDKCTFCVGDLDHRTFNYAQYLAHKESVTNNYFNISTDNIVSGGNDDMRSWFPTGVKYRAYLVANSRDPEEVYDEMLTEYAAIGATTQATKIAAIDACAPSRISTDEITAVILISYKTLGLSEED